MPEYASAINGRMGYESEQAPTIIAADGIVTVHPKRITEHCLDGTGGAWGLEIDLPTPGLDDGKIMRFWAEGVARAHVITQLVDGFNHKGAVGTATWAGAALGESLTLIAHDGHWWTLSLVGVTIA